ncbi:uncharacterized protein N7479_004442 [Penicillium vulpinum]|uniref:Uncharacterized protein n=1 Tax=Penicillium vulpinum TaxID=29845 RepID=A0A1V6SCP8_9EURO|nr:uncharacterized protein N7479_004442 [Penicillium vulpinum]KAJ5964566.1 hypothetical protein N7479_004442 [Penicillium vulpinum]OQE11373.1 hypothetical protein PENVUL_c002G01506 [Penicillium vulpinum]
MLFLILIYSIPVLAIATEETGSLQVGWQGGPDRRGTWDIILSCLTTIVACTWSIQHLNVPGQADHDGAIRETLRRLKWMAITVFLPEFILAHAFFELILAVQGTEDIKKYTDRKVAKYPWMIRPLIPKSARSQQQDVETVDAKDGLESKKSKSENLPKSEGPGEPDTKEIPDWTLAHSYFANMGGFHYQGSIHFPLTASQYAQEYDIYEMPKVTGDDIADKSKLDFFAKGIALLQIAQLVLSLIVRKTQSLPFSQLEALTLGLAAFGIGTYIVYWYKPQDIGVPITVWHKKTSAEPLRFIRNHDNLWEILTNHRSSHDDQRVDRIKNDNIPVGASKTTHVAIPTLAIMSAAFGCLHLIAWNFHFPTEIEKTLWRVATVLSITVPMTGLAIIPLTQITLRTDRTREFMCGCINLLREISWHCRDSLYQQDLYKAKTRLEDIYAVVDKEKMEQTHYKEIFSDRIAHPVFLDCMISFLENGPHSKRVGPVSLPRNFLSDFKELVDCLNGDGPKTNIDNAKTNVFPRTTLLPKFRKEFNLCIIYATSLVYCLSRLMILGLAFSSLRSMPDEVYIDTWTTNIPAI